MMKPPRIFAFHLLNDRSGSPKVLSQVLQHWVNENLEVHLYTNRNENGFLSNIPHIKYHHGWYVFKFNPWLRLIYYTFSQFILMLRMWKKIDSSDIVYVNTVLPFGAAIIGKLKGARVIYHIHESTVNPRILKWFLIKVMKSTAHAIINVSHYVQNVHQINTVPNHLLYNAIDNQFVENVLPKNSSKMPSHVLMVCSLKKYKGVFEFIQLARDHRAYEFKMVLNATQKEIDAFFIDQAIPQNLCLFPSQQDLHPFYQWADIVLNLSRPDGWIETFGLTIIEGMVYGLPAIVPPIGGITEVIEEGVTGYGVDSRDSKLLGQTLVSILSNDDTYALMSQAAKKRIQIFKEEKMRSDLMSIIEDV